MTSAPAYRQRISPEDSLEQMHAQVGETLDPLVFETLADVIHMHPALEFVESGKTPAGQSSLINLEITNAA